MELQKTQLAPTALYPTRWDVTSPDSGKPYRVSQKLDSTWACSCPRWIFKKGVKTNCKHIKWILNEEPVDFSRTSAEAAEKFKQYRQTPMDTPMVEPVFLRQTKREIRLVA